MLNKSAKRTRGKENEMNGKLKPMRARATYPDYEDADVGRVGAMKTVIAANGGQLTGEAGGEEDNEYTLVFRYATLDEFNRIEALGADEGWEVERW